MDGVSVGGVAYEEADVVHELYVTRGRGAFCLEMWNVLVDIQIGRPNEAAKKMNTSDRSVVRSLNYISQLRGSRYLAKLLSMLRLRRRPRISDLCSRSASLKLRVEAAAEKAKLSFNA